MFSREKNQPKNILFLKIPVPPLAFFEKKFGFFGENMFLGGEEPGEGP